MRNSGIIDLSVCRLAVLKDGYRALDLLRHISTAKQSITPDAYAAQCVNHIYKCCIARQQTRNKIAQMSCNF